LVDKISTGETGLSARYAAALYALAAEQGVLDETVDQMAALGRLITESDAFARLVKDRLLDARQAAGPLDKVLEAQGFSHLIRNFVGVIAANRRLRDLAELVSGFAAYAAAKRGEVIASVASAHPLTDLQRVQLRARLTEAGYGTVRLDEHIDPSRRPEAEDRPETLRHQPEITPATLAVFTKRSRLTWRSAQPKSPRS
jgi:F-type H+-transporting ATPase subunit delta